MRNHPVLVFPAATQRGGVERFVWEALHHLSRTGPVTFVGERINPPILGVQHLMVRQPRRGALRATRFRVAAGRAIRGIEGPTVVGSFGANCPPGDVVLVNSIHRTWLRRSAPLTAGPLQLPAAVRYLMLRHLELLALEGLYYRAARKRKVIAVADQVAKELDMLWGIPTAGIEIIHNGYSPEQCSPERRAALRPAMRKQWNIADDTLALLLVGNELQRKGLATLMHAVAIHGDPRWEIHVVGNSSLEPFQALASQLGLTGRLFHHGSVDIGEAHAAADILVLPTQYEAFALTVVEALASGLPVVTSSVPGAGDLVRDGHNGLLISDASDTAHLVHLLDVLTEPQERERLGRAAPAAAAGLDWPHLTGRYEQLITPESACA